MTTERKKVWPAKGLKIRDEYTGQPIKGGDEVPYTRLTIIRLRDGDLLEEDPGSDDEPAESADQQKPDPYEKTRGPDVPESEV